MWGAASGSITFNDFFTFLSLLNFLHCDPISSSHPFCYHVSKCYTQFHLSTSLTFHLLLYYPIPFIFLHLWQSLLLTFYSLSLLFAFRVRWAEPTRILNENEFWSKIKSPFPIAVQSSNIYLTLLIQYFGFIWFFFVFLPFHPSIHPFSYHKHSTHTLHLLRDNCLIAQERKEGEEKSTKSFFIFPSRSNFRIFLCLILSHSGYYLYAHPDKQDGKKEIGRSSIENVVKW